jgi:hypothetical protein
MLERQALLIRPEDATGRRVIVDPETGTPVGHAFRSRGLLRGTLEVREAEDEPLLFTVRGGWLPWPGRAVRDAEGHAVGWVGAKWVKNRWGRRVAVLEAGGRGRSVFRGRQGRELALLQEEKDGSRLRFRAEIDGEPFFKMLLLAAALME